MICNELLIQQVETTTTSASIHAISEAITNYRIAVDIANGTYWATKNKPNQKALREMAIIKAESIEIYLKDYLKKGVFDKTLRPRMYV